MSTIFPDKQRNLQVIAMLLHNNSGQCEINELWLLLLSTGLTFQNSNRDC